MPIDLILHRERAAYCVAIEVDRQKAVIISAVSRANPSITDPEARIVKDSAPRYFIADPLSVQALDYLNIFRCFIAILLAALFFSPVLVDALEPDLRYWGQLVTVVYLIFSPIQLYLSRTDSRPALLRTTIGLLFDIGGTLTTMGIMGGLGSGVGALLVGPAVVAGVVFSLRVALSVAAFATLALLWQTLVRFIEGTENITVLAPAGILGATYFVTALLGHYLAARFRESQRLAVQQSVDLAHLSKLNELIVARMRTGILIVDTDRACHVMNDAAWYLMGMPPRRAGQLDALAPEVVENLEHWQATGRHLNQPLTLANGVPDVVPRFARLSASEDSETLIFLEDTSMVSRRAQELTLASLGRLSASIAHEIRNPLAAISHSAQLLGESDSLVDGDRRLSDIIARHCRRMNDIIENVLQLARQEPPRPESVNLRDWLMNFVDELNRLHEIGENRVTVEAEDSDLAALIDPGQLQQVLWNLCQNAFRYGRRGDEPAQVTLSAYAIDELGAPVIEVRDRGPGVPKEDQPRIFQPFFTSASGGTGLGLYLCQQICTYNQALLEYRDADDGAGSVFRLSMQRPPAADESSPDTEPARADEQQAR